MRKGKHFTPALLAKWARVGRGTGHGAHYQPWHQVTRSDPASRGRSHLVPWHSGRLLHLLSDQEFVALCFAAMLPDLVDVREQYPLDAGCTDLHRIDSDDALGIPVDTQTICREFGIRHPVVRKNGDTAQWVMTTDLLLTLRTGNGPHTFLAIAVKDDDSPQKPRTRELLRIEREYWRRLGIPWLLLTPCLFRKEVATNLRYSAPWVVGQPAMSRAYLDAVDRLSRALEGATLTTTFRDISKALSLSQADAQSTFWQAVWSGRTPLDLSVPFRAETPLAVLSTAAFWAQNPIASRRTSWCD